MRRTMLVLGLVAVFGATCLPPVDTSGTSGTEKREAALRPFQSAEEMRAWFAEQALARRAAANYPAGFGCAGAMSAPLDYMGTGAGEDRGNGGDYSTTNLQEAGVDESDVVKNDGTYLYILKGDSVRIVRAVPPDAMTQLARVDLPSSPHSLYLRGNTLVALSQFGGAWDGVALKAVRQGMMCPPGVRCGGGPGGKTAVTVIDVTNRAAPARTATLTFDGDMASSRLIDNKLHLVLVSMPDLPETDEEVLAMPLEDWLPAYEIVNLSVGVHMADGPGGAPQTGKAIGWEDAYHPANPDGYGITSVITVDIDNPAGEFKPVAITADAGTIYASRTALYVTDTNYSYSFRSFREDTVIHKFDLTGDAAAYVASGLVPGRLLNQYSLGENDGHLRLASTVSAGAEGTPGNAVYVLREGSTAGKLDIVGRIEGIKPDEVLRAARFAGTRGFLVTFRQVDPLFTVDLADPTNPRIVGELKVPGFSEYIHMMGPNHLLTIGKDADETSGLVGGVQLAMFDVTNFAQPAKLWTRVIGVRGTESEAALNPKAFIYYPQRNALAIPIWLFEGTPSGFHYGYPTFTGLLVYRVTIEQGFSLLGRISTEDSDGSCDWCGAVQPAYTRGIFIGDDVYAATENVVKAAPIAAPEALTGTLMLPD